MNKRFISIILASAIGTAAVAARADEREQERDSHERESYEARDRDEDKGPEDQGYGIGSAFLSDPRYGLYGAECGGCHLAFPPSALPAASWQGMMGSLDNHFGDNAVLDAATASEVEGFLVQHAAREGGGAVGERTWRATRGRAAPLRITETDYFRGKHHEIPAKMVRDNPAVVSFSRCDACHSGAERGDFSEDGVRIPGFGRWDD